MSVSKNQFTDIELWLKRHRRQIHIPTNPRNSSMPTGNHTTTTPTVPATPAPTPSNPTTTTTTPPASTTPTTTTSTVGGKTVTWVQRIKEDFNTNAALGKVRSTYPQMGYYNGGPTTNNGTGTYLPDECLTVTSSVLDWHVHYNGKQYVCAAVSPDNFKGQKYGKWAIRFRADLTAKYKLAFLLWADSNEWKDGEIDFPEGELGDIINGFSHDVTGDPEHNAFSVNTGVKMNDWHIATIEWTPDYLSFTLDGVTKTTTDPKALPDTPMHLVLQVETDLDKVKPATSTEGHVQVDWVTIYSYLEVDS